jgi:hypothetical protein
VSSGDYIDQQSFFRSELKKAEAEFAQLTAGQKPAGSDGISINFDAKHDQLLNRIAFLNNQLDLQQPPVEFVSQGYSP